MPIINLSQTTTTAYNNALTKRKIKTEPFARGLRRRRVGGGVTADGCGGIVGEVKVGRLKH